MMRRREAMMDRARFIRESLRSSDDTNAEYRRIEKAVGQGVERAVKKFLAENYEKGLTIRLVNEGLEFFDAAGMVLKIVDVNKIYRTVEIEALLKEADEAAKLKEDENA